MYHEFTGAHLILTKGLEFGLVYGGTKGEREEALRRIAICLPGDWTAEETGGETFPKKALYTVTPEFEDMVKELRERLSSNDEPLSMIELSVPNTLERQIAVYSDVIDSEYKSVGGALKRIKDMCDGYDAQAVEAEKSGRFDEALYLKEQARISRSPEFLAKMSIIVSNIDQLADIY